MDEPTLGNGQTLNWSVIKDISGSPQGSARRPHGQITDLAYTATMLWSMNALPKLPTDGDGGAVERRLRVLPFEKIPEADHVADMKHVFRDDAKARQAFIAALVRASIAHPRPPDDTPTVADARAALHAESIGAVGVWLETHIVADKSGLATLSTPDLWEAVKVAFGDENGEIEGMTKVKLTLAVRDIHRLPVAKPLSRGVRGWRDVRLTTEAERKDEIMDDAHTKPLTASSKLHGYGCIHGADCPECIVHDKTVAAMIENGNQLMLARGEEPPADSWVSVRMGALAAKLILMYAPGGTLREALDAMPEDTCHGCGHPGKHTPENPAVARECLEEGSF